MYGCDRSMASPARIQKFSRQLKSRVLGFFSLKEGLAKVIVPAKSDRDFVNTTFFHEEAHRHTIENTIYGYILTALARLSTADQLPQDEREHWSRCYDKLASGAFNCLEGAAVGAEIVVARLAGGKDSDIIDRLPPDYRQAFACFRPLLKRLVYTNETRIASTVVLHALIEAVTEYALDRGFLTPGGLPADFDGIIARVDKLKRPDDCLRKAVKLCLELDWSEVDKARRERVAHHFGNIKIDDLPDDISTLEPLNRLVRDTTLIIKQRMSVLERGTKPLATSVADTVASRISTVRGALQDRWPGMKWPRFDPDSIADLVGQSALIFPKAETQFAGKSLTLEAFKDSLEREQADAERQGAVLRFYRKINGRYDVIAHPISSSDRVLKVCSYLYYAEDITADDIACLDEKFQGSKHLWQTFFAELEDKLLEADLIARLTLPVFLYKRLFSDSILRGIIDRKRIGTVKCVRVYSLPDDLELHLTSLEVVEITDERNVHAYWLAKAGLLGSNASFFGLPVAKRNLKDDFELLRIVMATLSMERGEDADLLPHF